MIEIFDAILSLETNLLLIFVLFVLLVLSIMIAASDSLRDIRLSRLEKKIDRLDWIFNTATAKPTGQPGTG